MFSTKMPIFLAVKVSLRVKREEIKKTPSEFEQISLQKIQMLGDDLGRGDLKFLIY